MFSWWNDLIAWLKSLLWKQEMELTLVGLDNAGKTTLVNSLTGQNTANSIPTIGFNMRKVSKGSVNIKFWDIGGQPKFRKMWERFVVDSVDHERILDAKKELHELMGKDALRGVPLLVLGNKNDLKKALPVTEIIKQMGLSDLKDREVSCYSVSAKNSVNLDTTLRWLIKYGKKK